MNLQNLNLVELNAQEQKETEGGWIVPVLRGLAYGIQIGIAFDTWYQGSGYIDNDMGMPFAA